MPYISLTAIGKDKPGIVAEITKVLCDLRCNIEDSTMTILHDQFAMILIVKLANGVLQKTLSSKLNAAAKKLFLSLSFSQIPDFSSRKKKNANPYVISVYGKDKTGIVASISGFLAAKKVNITNVKTTLSKSAYIMLIEADFPAKLDVKKLSDELSSFAKELNLTAHINRAQSSEI